MSTQTIERNFKKNPHTARFLATFHSAAYGLPSDVVAETPVGEDLLDLVTSTEIVDLRTAPQAKLMADLVERLLELDAEVGEKAAHYTAGMTVNGCWTPGREGNASAWITKMIAKEKELKAANRVKPGTPTPKVEDGRYAVEVAGELKFFKVTNGRNAGFVFLDVQASDEWYAIRNVTRIREVLALIAVDPKAAMIRYGHELGQCGRCGRTLTDEASRAAGIGPICIDK
jgi:hypothetical protein